MGKFNINNLVKQVLEESLQEKADDLVGKLKTRMQEWNQEVNISNQPGDVVEGDDMESVPNPGGCKKIKEMIANGGKDELGKLKEYCGKSEMDEEMEEGNAFTGALAKAKKSGDDSFNVDGKKYSVKEDKGVCSECGLNEEVCECGGGYMEEGQDFDFSFTDEMNEGKKLEAPEGEKMSMSKLNKTKKELTKKSEGGKKLSSEDAKLLKQVNLALKLKDVKEPKKDTLKLTESEMVELIQKLVMEEKKTKGMAETEKVLTANKRENDAAIKAVTKKMKDYLKNSTKGEYKENPEEFPLSNYQIDKDAKIKKYTPSEAVDEYIDAFSYPGMTNLVYDEIKPDDEKIDKYLKGDSTTGNATKDKKGKALGNVVPSKTGEKFKKNYDENLYGQEQMNASYKRYPQDTIEVAGDVTKKGSLKGKKTAQSVLNKVDESTTKQTKVLSEEFNKMKHLIGYNKKTQ
jgi:hypothetical protein